MFVILSILFSSWFWQACIACSLQSNLSDLLRGCTLIPAGQWTAFQLVCGQTNWGQHSRQRRTMGCGAGITVAGRWQMQSLADKHKSFVAHPLDLPATVLQKVSNIWIISYDFHRTAIKLWVLKLWNQNNSVFVYILKIHETTNMGSSIQRLPERLQNGVNKHPKLHIF